MGLVDDITLTLCSGNGGNGVVRWRHEKYKEFGGPSGGDGGKGGDIVLRGVRDIHALTRYLHDRTLKAAPGNDGAKDSCHGRDGADVVVELPVGSVITDTETGESVELLEEGGEVVLCEGGSGGLGNEHFKSSTMQRPYRATKGAQGICKVVQVELALIADIGLVGLPNAGKSSLLNALTNAKARVGEYPFTTLDPNLGVYHGHVIADIPGLIAGAHEGKGLGKKFLKHIARTSFILHCISVEREDCISDYLTVRAELDSDEKVAGLPEYLLLTKADTCSPEELEETRKLLSTHGTVLGSVSVLDDASLKSLGDRLTQMLAG